MELLGSANPICFKDYLHIEWFIDSTHQGLVESGQVNSLEQASKLAEAGTYSKIQALRLRYTFAANKLDQWLKAQGSLAYAHIDPSGVCNALWQVARVMLLEESSTVGSVQSHVMQVLVTLDLQASCILVSPLSAPISAALLPLTVLSHRLRTSLV